MLVAFSTWLISYLKKHKWSFEVTSDYVIFESPFMPKSKEKIHIDAISEVRLFEGDTVSGKVFMKSGDVSNIPSQCLSKIDEIANCLEAKDIAVYLNNREI